MVDVPFAMLESQNERGSFHCHVNFRGGGVSLKMSHRTFSKSTRRLDETKCSTDMDGFFQIFFEQKGPPWKLL